MASREMSFRLENGIVLAVLGDPGDRLIALAAEFLAGAMGYFKHRRDVLKEGAYTGGNYHFRYGLGSRKGSSVFELRRDGEPMATADWVAAVIRAYTRADTLEQIAEEIDTYRAASAGGGWVHDVVAALDRPGGEAEALQLMFSHRTPGEG